MSSVNAEQVLQPGDVMIKLINTKSQASSWGITVSETAIQQWYKGFSEAAAKGTPAAVHVAMYVGNGETAEAHGKSDEDNAGVGLRKLAHHAGYIWIVYRPNDPRFGVDAAKVARTWSTMRMGYKLPWDVPFHNSNFGSNAQKEALAYGKAANVPGGPAHWSEMFCSQFVIAAYQAGMVARALQANPNLSHGDIKVLAGMDRHASYTSPLVMQGHLEASTVGFRKIGLIVTQLAPTAPTPPLRPPEGGKTQPKYASLKGLSGKCLDAQWLAGKQEAGKGSKIRLWECTGSANQKWKFANGRLESEAGGLCLAVDNGKLEAGRQLLLWDCHSGNDERWESRNGRLVVSGTQLCADVKGENPANGTPIILYGCGAVGKPNQLWIAAP